MHQEELSNSFELNLYHQLLSESDKEIWFQYYLQEINRRRKYEFDSSLGVILIFFQLLFPYLMALKSNFVTLQLLIISTFLIYGILNFFYIHSHQYQKIGAWCSFLTLRNVDLIPDFLIELKRSNHNSTIDILESVIKKKAISYFLEKSSIEDLVKNLKKLKMKNQRKFTLGFPDNFKLPKYQTTHVLSDDKMKYSYINLILKDGLIQWYVFFMLFFIILTGLDEKYAKYLFTYSFASSFIISSWIIKYYTPGKLSDFLQLVSLFGTNYERYTKMFGGLDEKKIRKLSEYGLIFQLFQFDS